MPRAKLLNCSVQLGADGVYLNLEAGFRRLDCCGSLLTERRAQFLGVAVVNDRCCSRHYKNCINFHFRAHLGCLIIRPSLANQ